MKTISFTYTKAKGTTSDRVLVVLKSPDTMYEGIDISEISPEAQGEFLSALGKVQDKYIAAIDAIKNEFDLVHSYRRFDPTKMTNVITEII